MVIDQGREALPAQRFLRGRDGQVARRPLELRAVGNVGTETRGGSASVVERQEDPIGRRTAGGHTSLDFFTTRRGTDARRTQEPVAAPEIAEIGSLYGRREAKSRCDGAGY
jgi:hypothetical protein